MTYRTRHELVLGIFPNTRGFGFALFEGPLSPVDWGAIRVRGLEKNQRCIKRFVQLLDRYSPNVVVLQDLTLNNTHRTQRIRELNEGFASVADSNNVPVVMFSRAQVRQSAAEAGVTSRHTMAAIIAKHIPMLKRFVPPARKPWMNEDPRMALFEAVGLVLTFFRFGLDKCAR